MAIIDGKTIKVNGVIVGTVREMNNRPLKYVVKGR